MLGAIKVSSSELVPNGTQVWLHGTEVVDVTTNERAAFFAMFGLMQIPAPHVDGVVLSTADFEAFEASARTVTS